MQPAASSPGEMDSTDETSSLLSSTSSARHEYSTLRSKSKHSSWSDIMRSQHSSQNCDRPSQEGTQPGHAGKAQPHQDLSRFRSATEAYVHFEELEATQNCSDMPYAQFTAIDWFRERRRLRKGHPTQRANHTSLSVKLKRNISQAHPAFIIALLGTLVAILAFAVGKLESWFFDIKFGYCRTNILYTRSLCCPGPAACASWVAWGDFSALPSIQQVILDCLVYTIATVLLACLSALLVKQHGVPWPVTKMGLSDGKVALSLFHEDSPFPDTNPKLSLEERSLDCPASGSGVAEVLVILSGFAIRGFLGARLLFLKAVCLVLSVASGLCIGKEGPFIHMACSIANLVSRLAPEYYRFKVRLHTILSAGVACGIAVAFGTPIAGVLFLLEQSTPPLSGAVRVCALSASVVAAAVLMFLNPYGTSSALLFQVRIEAGWHGFELGLFALLGAVGGGLGAVFIRATRLWAKHVRDLPLVRRSPIMEVAMIAALTGLTTFWNEYTNLPAAKLLSALTAQNHHGRGGSQQADQRGLEGTVAEAMELSVAFVIKFVLTVITYGARVPAGIYIPTLILGALLGRIVGLSIQALLDISLPHSTLAVNAGVYAFIAAGATMCGVTRLTITTMMIMLEISGSPAYVVPFGIAIMAAKGTAHALEPESIYDDLARKNNYPWIKNQKPLRDLERLISDVMKDCPGQICVDIAEDNVISAEVLYTKLGLLHDCGQHDGCLVLLREGALIGAIPTEDLMQTVRAAIRLYDGLNFCCQISQSGFHPHRSGVVHLGHLVDTTVVRLDMMSSLDALYEYFAKLGPRQVFIVNQGKYHGSIHKKAFIEFSRDQRSLRVDTGCPLLHALS